MDIKNSDPKSSALLKKKYTKKEEKNIEKDTLKQNVYSSQEDESNLELNNDESIDISNKQSGQANKVQKNSNKRKNECQSQSDSDEYDVEDKIQKKQKAPKDKQIEGSFIIEGFNWYSKERNGKEFLKIDHKKIPSSINLNCFSYPDPKKRESTGKLIHEQITQYFVKGSAFQDSTFNEQDNEFLLYQVKKTHEYLQKRKMSVFKTEALIQSPNATKKVDLLCENDEECIIVCFLYTKRTPELVVLVDGFYYYLDILETAESMFNHKKKVTVLIIPLLMLKSFRLIEFNKEEITEMQKDQELNQYFQANYKTFLESQLWKNSNLLLEKCDLEASKDMNIYQFIQDLFKAKNLFKKMSYQDLSNAPIRYNPRKRECLDLPSKKLFYQFYLVHTVLESKYQKYHLKKAKELTQQQKSIQEEQFSLINDCYECF